MSTSRQRVAVIGGGVSGLAAASVLAKHRPDIDLVIFDKGPGRLAGAKRHEPSCSVATAAWSICVQSCLTDTVNTLQYIIPVASMWNRVRSDPRHPS